MDLKLKDKTFMVAAASKGLGFGVASALASEGARVSIASRDADQIERAASEINSRHPGAAIGYVFDAADSESITRWTNDTIADFGPIAGLVVNAGGPPAGTFDDFDDAAWAKAFELTLLSSVRMIRSVLPSMRKNKSGSILTITSITVKEPIEILLLSNVFRSGVVSLVKSLSFELAADGIRVNNLVPGRIDTDRVRSLDAISAQQGSRSVSEQKSLQENSIPLGRYGSIEEFGSAAAFLLSDVASYITGATLMIDGGKTRTVW